MPHLPFALSEVEGHLSTRYFDCAQHERVGKLVETDLKPGMNVLPSGGSFGNAMFQDRHLVVRRCVHDMDDDVVSPMFGGTLSSDGIMIHFLKSSVLWQFAGGFVLGTVGLVALQPADATREMVSRFVPTHEVR